MFTFFSKMNATSMMSLNNSTTMNIEPWFIPLDIIALLCLSSVMILASIFLFLIFIDRACHTVPMLLTANMCLTGFICGCAHFFWTVYQLYHDINQIQHEDSLCYIIGYSSYATAALHNYSYVSSAIYRYITIVYSNRLFWQSARAQLLLIGLGWFLAFILPLLFVFTNTMIYNVDNQVCQVPFRLSVIIIYAPMFIYIIPVHLVVFIYMKLVRFVREMGQRITPANTLSRAQRDLKMVRRIVILIHILFISGFPISLFIFLSFGNLAPKYHFRIGFIFVEASLLFVLIALFQFTDSFKTAVKKLIHGQRNIIAPTVKI